MSAGSWGPWGSLFSIRAKNLYLSEAQNATFFYYPSNGLSSSLGGRGTQRTATCWAVSPPTQASAGTASHDGTPVTPGGRSRKEAAPRTGNQEPDRAPPCWPAAGQLLARAPDGAPSHPGPSPD